MISAYLIMIELKRGGQFAKVHTSESGVENTYRIFVEDPKYLKGLVTSSNKCVDEMVISVSIKFEKSK